MTFVYTHASRRVCRTSDSSICIIQSARMHACASPHICVYKVCMYACMYACMSVRMHECMYGFYVCMYVCMNNMCVFWERRCVAWGRCAAEVCVLCLCALAFEWIWNKWRCGIRDGRVLLCVCVCVLVCYTYSRASTHVFEDVHSCKFTRKRSFVEESLRVVSNYTTHTFSLCMYVYVHKHTHTHIYTHTPKVYVYIHMWCVTQFYACLCALWTRTRTDQAARKQTQSIWMQCENVTT